VLIRGLATDPAARFASLDDLLDALAPRERVRGGMLAAGAALLTGIVMVAWLSAGPAEPDQRCTGAAAAYASTWNPQRRSAVEAAFTATHVPFAAAALRQAEATLDRYAARWTEAHTTICRATRILRRQAETTLDLRMMCLERRRQEAAALIDTLMAANPGVVIRSVEATAGLPDVVTCADVTALQQLVTPPVVAATRDKLAALTPRLAEARAKLEIGAFAAGLAIARPVTEQARTLGYRPFEAEALLIQGELEAELGDRAHAEATFEAATLAAEAGRHDEIAARARARLVFIVGVEKAEYARALAIAPFATAAIARLGGNAEIEALLENALGSIDLSRSKLESSVVHFENALALRERLYGRDHSGVAHVLNGLGTALLKQGKTDRAALLFQRARATFERALGPDHPLVAQELCMLGSAHVTLGNPILGEQEIRRALAIREAAFGADHPDALTNVSFLARALSAQGRDDEALKLLLQVTPRAEHAWGREHPVFAKILVRLGAALGHAGRYVEAAEQLDRAEAIFTKLYGPDHVLVASVHTVFAGMLISQSRWRQAAARYERVVPVFEVAQGSDDGRQEARVNLARAYIELRQPVRALEVLEPLVHQLDEQPWQWRGDIRFMLARALWDSGRDHTRAHELATIARPELVRAAKAREVENLDRWLASHRTS
jgi:tetratricopeptide (TPR) repeat protein